MFKKGKTMLKIGVLSYQGSVTEHVKMLNKTKGVLPVEVKTLDALNAVDGLILPGGESTTISKLMAHFGLLEPIRRRINAGMPVWGTCAGLILLAKTVVGEASHLGVMDIAVRRNAYGRQIDSFCEDARIDGLSSKPIPLVFIRAPWIESVYGNAEVLAQLNGHIIAARQGHMLATSFHPELTDCTAVHEYFVNTVRKSNEKRE